MADLQGAPVEFVAYAPTDFVFQGLAPLGSGQAVDYNPEYMVQTSHLKAFNPETFPSEIAYHGYASEGSSFANIVITGVSGVIQKGDQYEQLKDYEARYKMPSTSFIQKWNQGEISPSPESLRFANLHRTIFNV